MRNRAVAVAIVLAAVVGLSGCATIADRVGIASKQYTDEQTAQALESAKAASAEQLDARIKEIAAELESVRQDAAAMKQATDDVAALSQSLAEIQDLAGVFENQLTILPEETLRKLVEILSAYLDEKK